MKKELDTVAKILSPTYGVTSMLIETIMKSSNQSKKILEEGNPEAIEDEIRRKKLEHEILEMEAKIAQEMNIAERIKNAIDVEIEEYYEGNGKGQVGGSLSSQSINFNLSGEGRKIAKRIYKFKGNINLTEKKE